MLLLFLLLHQNLLLLYKPLLSQFHKLLAEILAEVLKLLQEEDLALLILHNNMKFFNSCKLVDHPLSLLNLLQQMLRQLQLLRRIFNSCVKQNNKRKKISLLQLLQPSNLSHRNQSQN
jgi:hypothetical protein